MVLVVLGVARSSTPEELQCLKQDSEVKREIMREFPGSILLVAGQERDFMILFCFESH